MLGSLVFGVLIHVLVVFGTLHRATLATSAAAREYGRAIVVADSEAERSAAAPRRRGADRPQPRSRPPTRCDASVVGLRRRGAVLARSGPHRGAGGVDPVPRVGHAADSPCPSRRPTRSASTATGAVRDRATSAARRRRSSSACCSSVCSSSASRSMARGCSPRAAICRTWPTAPRSPARRSSTRPCTGRAAVPTSGSIRVARGSPSTRSCGRRHSRRHHRRRAGRGRPRRGAHRPSGPAAVPRPGRARPAADRRARVGGAADGLS